jgi:thiol-disulfide isomerase/thioredoxin
LKNNKMVMAAAALLASAGSWAEDPVPKHTETVTSNETQAIVPQNNAAAPNCALTSIEDKQRYNMAQFRGRVLYVDFWASWCGPCAQSFPFMNGLDREFRDQGLQVLGINVDEKPRDALTFLVKHPAGFHIAADSTGQCPKAFGVKAMPSSYLIDRNGVIRHVHLGFRPGQANQLRDKVLQLLAEKPAAP